MTKAICSQCNKFLELKEMKHTGTILATRVGDIHYSLCSDDCLAAFYKEIVKSITGKDI